MDLTSALSAALSAAGLTRRELADRLGIVADSHDSFPAISRWFSGRTAPSLPTLGRLSEALGRPLSFEVEGALVTVTAKPATRSHA